MTRKIIFGLLVLLTTISFGQALDLQAPPQELATSIVDVCNNKNDCIDFKKFILWDIFQDEKQEISFRLNILFTLIYLGGI